MLLVTFSAQPVHAQTFAEDAQAAAAKGSVTLNDIPAIKKFLKVFGAKKLGNLKLANAMFEGGVLKANVKVININWRFTGYSGGTLKDTFFTFGPTGKVSFKKMFKKVPGIELLDILVFDDQLLAIAGADLEIDAGDLPDSARRRDQIPRRQIVEGSTDDRAFGRHFGCHARRQPTDTRIEPNCIIADLPPENRRINSVAGQRSI